ncbi:GNAT family N-acetyltransferase [Clostridium gasigenes]|uniref:GNAT family N-acetyltransferase n=2 Tax=Clostridium gasigenes TaxID=94869 RepID=UPI001C0AEE44|nr:GNAT family N-acetyltransferase [Clostridium gasigenes]MBU3134844.1 GNAT family N-acetyltransferase [Clostridium gasigenes]
MKEFDMLKFELLEEKDIEILTPIMEKSFDEDARIHLNEPKGGPPGYDNGDFLREYGLSKESTSYKISLDGQAIGCIILWINNETKINFLGNIFIDVSLQNKGIGKRVWRFIEEEYPNTIKWCTDTPGFSKRNHNFYVNKCGFHIVRIENPMDKYKCSYIMEKEINPKY